MACDADHSTVTGAVAVRMCSEGEKHEQIQLTSYPWTWWECVHSLKNSGGKLLCQFPETSFSGKEVWLWSQKLRCLVNSTISSIQLHEIGQVL